MDFNTLLQQAQRLASEAKPDGKLPQMERTLPQVLQATQELHARVTQTGTKDIQAHIFLGSKGIDLPKLTQKLEELSARKTFEPLDPISDTDVPGFLKNERENAILSVIEEVNRSSYESAEKLKWQNIRSEWRQEKTRLLNALVGPSQDFIDIQRIPEPTMLNEASAPRSRLDRIEMEYAKEVVAYNEMVLKSSQKPNLVQKFAKVAESFGEPRINEIWSIISFMVDVSPIPSVTDPIVIRQQTPKFVHQAKRYLEQRFKAFMTTIIKSNLRSALRGGIPNTYNLVSAFVGLTFNHSNSFGLQDPTPEGKPLWPMVYYSLRCGEPQAALTFLKNEKMSEHEDFIEMLEEKIKKPKQNINSKLEGQLKLHYNNKIKNSTDPYKKAVYCIALGCDPNDQHSQVAKTTDDFLWMQLSILRSDEDNREYHLEQMTYAGLQSMILEKYGEKYFNAKDQAHVYFQVLALTGQFEAAIEFLARNELLRVHAVHIALALNELYLLPGPRSVSQPLMIVDVNDPVPMRRLNIARLLMLFVKRFETTDTAEALQYYFFLRNMKDPEGRNLFLISVCDLAIETRNFDIIFGILDKSGNGRIIGGLFQRFNCVDFDTRSAAAIVAEELVKRGLFEQSIRLFDLAGIHNQALRYISILLSQVVHQKSLKGSQRERLVEQAMVFRERLRAHQIQADMQVASTFNLLTDLLTFFDYFHERKHRLAMDTLAKTRLVPMSMDDLQECVMNFKRLSGEICKVFPDIMLSAMDILYAQYKETKGESGFVDTSKDAALQHLRQKAKALTNMAATVPYRMPGDTNKRLVQIEILMH